MEPRLREETEEMDRHDFIDASEASIRETTSDSTTVGDASGQDICTWRDRVFGSGV
jgi:hypothetical protein